MSLLLRVSLSPSMRRQAAGFALCLCISMQAAGGEPAPLRIGVPYLPPPANVPAARLYTQEGFELDLAAEIGRRAGRQIALIDVGRGGAAALASGRVHALVIRVKENDGGFAAMEVLPAGYESGLSVAMRSDTDIRSWDKLAGRTVCVAAPNEDAQRLARSMGAKLALQPVPALSLMRVRTGECDAAIHDAEMLKNLFGDPEWTKFSATLPTRDKTRLAVVLPRASGPAFDAVRSALRSGVERAFWREALQEWAKNVALEVYLDQDGPDCH